MMMCSSLGRERIDFTRSSKESLIQKGFRGTAMREIVFKFEFTKDGAKEV